VYSEDSQGNTKMDKNGSPVKRYQRDPNGKLKTDSRGHPIVKRKRKSPSSRRPASKGRSDKTRSGPDSDSEETVYSEDSLGRVKLDSQNKPKPKYVRDPKTNKVKKDNQNRPIV